MLTLVALIFASPVTARSIAWWVTAEYKPAETRIEGVPVETIDPSWSKVLVLNKKNCCQGDSNKLDELKEDKEAVFSLEGDFNKDGTKDKIIVGVYRDKADQEGQFLLVLTRYKRGWGKVFLRSTFGKPGFSILAPYKEKGKYITQWAFCIGCDDFVVLLWEDGQYKIK